MAEEKDQSVLKTEITEKVMNRINEYESTGALMLPKDYSVANALKGAMLVLQDVKDRNGKLALDVCTRESIAMSLLKMCVQGLSVVKGQGYFIVYGSDLTWSRSYQGSIALARRVGSVSNVKAQVVYDGDDFSFSVDTETGFKKITRHVQKLENINNSKILGAYAIVTYNDGVTDAEIMTAEEIKAAWNQGATKGKSPAHTNFTQEMSKKTVINRACKGPINSSSDSYLFNSEDEAKQIPESKQVSEEAKNNTMTQYIDFSEVKEDSTPKNLEKGEQEDPPY